MVTTIQDPGRFTAEKLAILFFDARIDGESYGLRWDRALFAPSYGIRWNNLEAATQKKIVEQMQDMLDALVAEGILA